MLPTRLQCAGLLLGTAALWAPTMGRACSLVSMDALRTKQLMAREIGYRLGLGQRAFPLEAISTPQMHAPLGLDSLCRGRGALHYSAGFRFAQAWRIGPGPWLPPVAKPPPGAMPADRKADAEVDPRRWPAHAQCSYEGVAVVLGHDESSPVAVHFQKSCG